MSDRCTGHCCKAFVLPYPMDELRRRASSIQDGEYIVDMVVPLYSGPRRDVPPEILKSSEPNVTCPGHAQIDIYTCRHFDGANCTQYESRPEMCRDFPYSRACPYPKCEWKKAVAGMAGRGSPCETKQGESL